MGVTKLARFLPKSQHTQRKLLNFENWVNGEVSTSAKSTRFKIFISYKSGNLHMYSYVFFK